MNDHVARMLLEAKGRLHDASLLARTVTHGNSDALLRVLALEILLKASHVVEAQRYPRIHDYSCLWRRLSDNARSAILAGAEQRDPGCLVGKDLDQILRDWEFVFTRSRYYFERYEGYTLQEQHELGKLWIELGAPITEAEVKYHLSELEALCSGLIAYIEHAA
jgi:HEPN domain-containing protein